MRGDEAGLGFEGVDRRQVPRFLVLSLLQDLAQLPAGSASSARDPGGEAVLRILQDHLGLAAAGIFSRGDRVPFAGVDFPDEAAEVLWSPGADTDPLMVRAMESERILLIGRGSVEPCLGRMRDLDLDWQSLAVVPLATASEASAILVLAARDGTILSRDILAGLHPVFGFLAGFLRPSRVSEGSSAEEGGMPSVEDLEAELEALRSRNTEVEDLLRMAGETSAAEEAARRVELEEARVQIVELESSLAGAAVSDHDTPCEACDRLQRAAAEAEVVIHALEEEIERQRGNPEEHVPAIEVDLDMDLETDLEADLEVDLDADLDLALQDVSLSIEETPEPDATDPLHAMVGAVVELVGDAEKSQEVVELVSECGEEAAFGTGVPSSLVAGSDIPTVDRTREPWVICPGPGASGMFDELADFAASHDLAIASPEQAECRASRKLLLLNLLVDDPGAFVGDLGTPGEDFRLLGYLAHGDRGASLGEIRWLSAMESAEEALAQIGMDRGIPAHTLLVSERLREMAPLREALTDRGSSVAMACDARQALDLLEIVQKPDAAILDLAGEGAATMALAARLYQENSRAGFPLFLLAPETANPAGFAADPAWADVFHPFGIADLQRLIAPWIGLH